MTRSLALGFVAVLSAAGRAGAEEPASPPTARFGDVATTAPSSAPPPASPPPSAPPPPAVAPPAPAPAYGPSAAVPPSASRSPSAPPSPYARREVVDPYRAGPPLHAPPPAMPIPQVDDLLIVNPYSTMLAGHEGGPRSRYFTPGGGVSVPGTLEIRVPTGFRGELYLNGIALSAVTTRITLLPGEHAVTVAPTAREPVTVWVRVDAGESRTFRFALGHGGEVVERSSGAVSTAPQHAEWR